MNYTVMVHKKAGEGRRRREGEEIKEDRYKGSRERRGKRRKMDNITN